MTKKSEGYPSELIEEINPADLEDRGKYEIVRCVFDISGLEETDFTDDVEDLIDRDHRDGFVVFDSSNKMMVRETGEKLRRINEMLETAKKIALTGNLKYQTYDLQHVEPETLLFSVRELMGMRDDENRMRDETLTFSVEPPPGNRIFLKGTPKRIEEFQNIAKMIDVPLTTDDGTMIEKPFLETYAIRGDPEMMFQIM